MGDSSLPLLRRPPCSSQEQDRGLQFRFQETSSEIEKSKNSIQKAEIKSCKETILNKIHYLRRILLTSLPSLLNCSVLPYSRKPVTYQYKNATGKYFLVRLY